MVPYTVSTDQEPRDSAVNLSMSAVAFFTRRHRRVGERVIDVLNP